MRKISAAFIFLALFSFFSIPLYSQNTDQSGKSKAINVVYDDSASMINEDGIIKTPGKYVDRWVQAKYAMEVFAAMLDVNDTMQIYYMSDFDKRHNGREDAPFRIKIEGKDGSQKRVKMIHDTVTEAWNTPYDTVYKAYNDLLKTNADVKWLVILTDGEFDPRSYEDIEKDSRKFDLKEKKDKQGIILKDEEGHIKKWVDVDKEFIKYGRSGVNIILLAMGNDAEVIRNDPYNNIFFSQAKNSKEILEEIKDICFRIFNRNRYPFPIVNMREFEFEDIPMKEFWVFIQGDNVGINFVIDEKEKKYTPIEPVTVKYSEEATINYYFTDEQTKQIIRNNIPRDDLTAVVAKFRNIPKGKYSLDISGEPKNVEIYIEPDVNLVVKLLRNKKEIKVKENNKEKILNDIHEDKYKIQYGIINEKGKFIEPKILKEITYEPEITINGKPVQINSDNTVKLTQGALNIKVRVNYLDFNTKDETIKGTVLPPKTLIEKIKEYASEHKWQLITLWGLFMLWFLWGRKHRFPREVKENKTPNIQEIRDDYDKPHMRPGEFKLNMRTWWCPICAEEAEIKVVPTGRSLPRLKVKAAKEKYNMILLNPEDFTPEKIRTYDADFRIGGNQIKDKDANNKHMEKSCRLPIKTTYFGKEGDSDTTCICTLIKSTKK